MDPYTAAYPQRVHCNAAEAAGSAAEAAVTQGTGWELKGSATHIYGESKYILELEKMLKHTAAMAGLCCLAGPRTKALCASTIQHLKGDLGIEASANDNLLKQLHLMAVDHLKQIFVHRHINTGWKAK